jgi:histidinol dehydrogenase
MKKAASKAHQDTAAIKNTVRQMLAEMAESGDEAIRRYAESWMAGRTLSSVCRRTKFDA